MEDALPPALLLEVATRLPPAALCALACTSKLLNSISLDAWRPVARRYELASDEELPASPASCRALVVAYFATRAANSVDVAVSGDMLDGMEPAQTVCVNLGSLRFQVTCHARTDVCPAVADAVLGVDVSLAAPQDHQVVACVAIQVVRNLGPVDAPGPTHCGVHVFRPAVDTFRFRNVAPAGALLLRRNGYVRTDADGAPYVVLRVSICAWPEATHASLGRDVHRVRGRPCDPSATLDAFEGGAVGAGWRTMSHGAAAAAPGLPPASVASAIARLSACTRAGASADAALACLSAACAAAEVHVGWRSKHASGANELVEVAVRSGAVKAALENLKAARSANVASVARAAASLRIVLSLSNDARGSAAVVRGGGIDVLRGTVVKLAEPGAPPPAAALAAGAAVAFRRLVADGGSSGVRLLATVDEALARLTVSAT